ncbi:helix-turn-helix transcriptional regulator [Lichenifustis flavocetrariae]|uniref:Helix-turn-helix domain-containing protein n=1 Tax=Lichenifustis flavocetrariae TaxID=2949735 RepID=A0AA41Z4U8_9HYPH|nr:hypothetical protein [Lichenifustis flavocetrariae]MCW6513102.1 helix-turn-helix domain-containing protein [Lichenifustis flavocetrariae]
MKTARTHSPNIPVVTQEMQESSLQTDMHVRHHTVREASAYCKSKHGYPVAVNTLNKLRTYGGGPKFNKCGGRLILYAEHELDAWVRERLGDVLTSTSAAKTGEAA